VLGLICGLFAGLGFRIVSTLNVLRL